MGKREESTAPGRERLKADLALLAVAAIWGSAFVAQRAAADHLGPFVYNGARFLLAVVVMLPFVARRGWRIPRAEWRGGALAGLLLFTASALQQAGLAFTTAGKAGFITGLYVVLVPLFMALGWRRWPRWSAWGASLLSAGGLFLLSTGGTSLQLAPGDGLELVGAVFWALHVILIGRLAAQVDVLRLAWVQYLVCGVLALGVGLVFERHTLGGFGAAWWAVVYTAVFSIGLGYTLQALGQRLAPPTDAAVILSGEAVFAALAGWVLLGEALTTLQLVGGGLMLGGMVLAQVGRRQEARSRRQDAGSKKQDAGSRGDDCAAAGGGGVSGV
ncbi:MAG: DMT family transporter [Anaerolineae bacterium]|nr:DMT family transporter [Anaerolineae bacterium]